MSVAPLGSGSRVVHQRAVLGAPCCVEGQHPGCKSGFPSFKLAAQQRAGSDCPPLALYLRLTCRVERQQCTPSTTRRLVREGWRSYARAWASQWGFGCSMLR